MTLAVIIYCLAIIVAAAAMHLSLGLVVAGACLVAVICMIRHELKHVHRTLRR